jgi:hypothetical protein
VLEALKMWWLSWACTPEPLVIIAECDPIPAEETGADVEATDTGADPAGDTGADPTGDTGGDVGGDTADTDTDAGETDAYTCDWSIYESAVQYADDNPERDGSSWSGWCGSLMWRFAELPESSARATAILAYEDSDIASLDPREAPQGAFHWWDIGSAGHVGIDLLGGGGTVFMASSYVLEEWGDAIGVTSVSRYGSTTGATYLGWSMDYASGELDGSGAEACDAGQSYDGAGTVPVTITQSTGSPNLVYNMRLQLWASQHDYTGPIDGDPGYYSWSGVQRALQSMGYDVDVTGSSNTETAAAMQSIAADYGYTGPIDGVFGTNSYKGFARFLNETL